MTTAEISLVQITPPFPSLEKFLYGSFERTIARACFIGKFLAFLDPFYCKFLSLPYPFCATDCYMKVHIYAVAVAEKDNPNMSTD